MVPIVSSPQNWTMAIRSILVMLLTLNVGMAIWLALGEPRMSAAPLPRDQAPSLQIVTEQELEQSRARHDAAASSRPWPKPLVEASAGADGQRVQSRQ